MSHAAEAQDCRRCGVSIEAIGDGLDFKCGCGTFSMLCDRCGSPFAGKEDTCRDCIDDAWEKE